MNVRQFAVFLPLAALVLALPQAAQAADASVILTDSSGRPVRDAVVIADGVTGPAPRPRKFRITQRDMAFHPFVLVVPTGSSVEFANLDPFRHHVYSFSRGNKFELRLFGKGESRSILFNTPGVAAIGCNIHDSMSAFVYVVSTSAFGQSDADGQVVLHDVGTGRVNLRIWHPLLRAPGNQLSVAIETNTKRPIPVQLKLRQLAPASHY
ncbi:MAG: methylamine utilization protein [Novosphingobium sp.]